MNQDARRILTRLQTALRCIDRHVDALWQATWLHTAVREAQREPAGAADAALPLEGQRSLVADREGIAHLLSGCELPEIKSGRVHIQLRLSGRYGWPHLHMRRDLRVPPV